MLGVAFITKFQVVCQFNIQIKVRLTTLTWHHQYVGSTSLRRFAKRCGGDACRNHRRTQKSLSKGVLSSSLFCHHSTHPPPSPLPCRIEADVTISVNHSLIDSAQIFFTPYVELDHLWQLDITHAIWVSEYQILCVCAFYFLQGGINFTYIFDRTIVLIWSCCS